MFVNSFPPNFAEQKRIRPLFLPEGMAPGTVPSGKSNNFVRG
jgi:hypothetical protein